MMRLLPALALLAGCSCDGTIYKGTFAGDREGGTLHLTLPDEPKTAVAGELAFSGRAAVPLSGTFDSASSALTVSGGGYELTGTLSKETLTGKYSGPRGAGTFAAQSTAHSSVTQYCGTFVADGAMGGVWDLTVGSDGLASGSYSFPDSSGGVVLGKVDDGQLKVSCGINCTATGTISGRSATGTWASGGERGSWAGSNDCP